MLAARCGAAGASPSEVAAGAPAGRADTVVVVLEPGQRVFSLGRKFIYEGSLSLYLGGRRLAPGVDYSADLTSGTVLLRRTFPLGSSVEARFETLPFEIREVYGGPWRGPRPLPSRGGPSAGTSGSALAAHRAGAALTVSGSKTLAFEIGTGKDFTVSQSLDLEITGKVGRDVEIKAVLSDRNLPVLPEGNTQTLEELDQVYVKVMSPSAQATFGDYTLTGPESEFGRMSRTVEGVQASAVRDGTSVTFATASPRGRFRSMEFTGEEGKQGPYYLTEPGGGATAVVPGSEKVWIDGRLARRGSAADYTIDYASGAITFTSARTITKDTRISVDYECAQEQYRRSLYAVGARSERGSLDVRAFYAVEKDDRDSPLGGGITEEQRARFEAAGDSMGAAAMPDSASQGGVSGTLVRPPSSHEMVDLGLSYAVGGGLSVGAEVAISDLDLNTFSGKDDSDNVGAAYSLETALSSTSLSVGGLRLGRISARGAFRRTERSFASMGRAAPVMDYDKWNLAPAAMTGGERRLEGEITYEPASRLSITAGAGELRMGAGSRSRLWSLSSSVRGRRGFSVRWRRALVRGLESESLREESRRDRAAATLRWAFGPVAPVLVAETESRDFAGGQRGDGYRKVGTQIEAAAGGAALGAALYVRDDYDETDGARSRRTRGVTHSYRVSYARGVALSLDARYGFRSLFVDSTGASIDTYVAHLEGAGRAADGAWSWRGNYEATSTDEGPREPVFVGPGKGHYDSEGRYVGVGDYELGGPQSGEPLSSRVSLRLSSEYDAGRGGSGGRGGFASRFRLSAVYRLEEHTRVAIASPARILKPSSYMNPDDVIRGYSTARAELEILPRGKILSPAVSYEVRRRLQAGAASGASSTSFRETAVRVRTRALPRTTVEAEQGWGVSESGGATGPAGLRRNTSESTARIVVRPGPGSSLSLRSSYVREVTGAGEGSRWVVEPSAGFSRPGAASFEARCKWTQSSQEGASAYDGLLGWIGDRVEYSVSAQVHLGAGLTLDGSLRASGLTWSDLSHYLRMEMRALF